MDRILYVSHVARRLQKSPITIRKWINMKVYFCDFKKLGKEWVTTEEKLEKYLRDLK